jgi:hypothetical protein
MKKLIYCALALAAGLLAASCQQENLEPAGQGDTVTYTVDVPGVVTKAIADGKNVDRLFYEVYKTNVGNTPDLSNAVLLYKKDIAMETSEEATSRAIVTLNLVQNQYYTVLFWAQCGAEDQGVYNVSDLKAVTYKDTTSMESNHENYAAFYAVDFISDSTPRNKKVYLERPFAQLNIGTKYTIDYEKDPYAIQMLESEVTVKKVPTVFNVATSAVSGEHNFTFKMHDVLGDELEVNGEPYKYVAMNYMFAGAEGRTAEVSYKINAKMTTQNGDPIDEVVLNKTVLNVPLKENYRTNIVGNLLTSSTDYEVIVDADWAGEDLAPDALFLAAANGGEVTLTKDVELTTPLVVNSEMTINLNGKTISGEFVKGNGAVVNIAKGASVILNGGTIKNTADNGDAAINNEGTLVLNGVTIEGAPLADGGYSAYAVISSGNMVIEEGTAISADRGSIKVTGAGETIINGGTFTNNDIGSRNLTSHVVDVEDESTHKLTINGGTFQHLHTTTSGGVVICNRTKGTVYVNGGNFSGGNYYGNDNLSDYGYGGTFSVKGGVFSANPAAKYIADGYKSVLIGANYHVLPNVVADAATAANVTAVTESTADVATALATNNGEATMFMWNDVAYIAKYGEVIITSSADEATTSRGIVEGAAGLTSATVAEGIEVVSNRTFRKCANLKTVVFPNTLTEIGPAVFQSCSKLENLTIPAGVTTIGEGAFAECTSLTSISIPAGVTRIEKDTFRNTGLISIEFHEDVTYFGEYAFRDSEELKEIIINAPEFTVEAGTFLNAAAPYPNYTIKVVNNTMKEYLESKLTNHQKTFITVVAPNTSDANALTEALANGKYVVMTQDIETEAATTAPYGNKYAFKLDGGVLDGNGHELYMECYGDDYGIMTSGGTIKNLTITEGCRAVMIMYPQQDVILDNVNIGGDGVLYPINTGEGGAEGVNLIVTNSVLAGWTSYSLIESATFTNVEFKQGTYYNNIYGRVFKPYVNTTMTNCSFVEHMNLDLSSLTAGHKITMVNCTVNGQDVNAEVFSIPSSDADYDTKLFTVDLPSWATSVNDCIIFN